MLKKLSFKRGSGLYTRRVKKKRKIINGNVQWAVVIKSNFSMSKQRIRRFKSLKIVWSRVGLHMKLAKAFHPTVRRRKKKKRVRVSTANIEILHLIKFI